MTEFDLLTLFNTFFDATFARLNDFMTGTFAMLIAAYFAGPRLNSTMAKLLMFLYSLFFVATSTPIMMSTNRFVSSAEQLRLVSLQPGSIIGELFPFYPSPTLVLATMLVLLLGAYIGTLAFFIQARKARS
ncbi:MAG TPA: hypothetical protein VKN35_13575 [Xanthomonadales bacterium]|nr:hypothetical protein [Xanthomonadales bacterium]